MPTGSAISKHVCHQLGEISALKNAIRIDTAKDAAVPNIHLVIIVFLWKCHSNIVSIRESASGTSETTRSVKSFSEIFFIYSQSLRFNIKGLSLPLTLIKVSG